VIWKLGALSIWESKTVIKGDGCMAGSTYLADRHGNGIQGPTEELTTRRDLQTSNDHYFLRRDVVSSRETSSRNERTNETKSDWVRVELDV